ncbi:hypothetical protein BHM03_00046336 [Ensete ventricosum]|uniref:Uncharacterized protein n=1 Tax=Ensete ventricosum TaxID=4639 RepID=A0A427A1S5_ENSVE|nr:hypothetical protein B296_00036726 [Ensete ventricosum]RZR74931.1 hypothetical protein BHM03_00046336 [Ensete ventricosum]
MEGKYRELRTAVDAVAAVDGHAHNLVDIDSSFPFLRCFSEAEGDALSLAPHTLSFKVSIRCRDPSTWEVSSRLERYAASVT